MGRTPGSYLGSGTGDGECACDQGVCHKFHELELPKWPIQEGYLERRMMIDEEGEVLAPLPTWF